MVKFKVWGTRVEAGGGGGGLPYVKKGNSLNSVIYEGNSVIYEGILLRFHL